ncbi:terminase small subunit [Spirosoma sp. KCTC 42546]|uniref:terminase small subunit n=1 Tax=Spirosoma sp. KCTC 42546 TaxID=2520506 RepID=UPI00115BBABD|nr:terminase small subunit [Spirosoma sp. KCTC 42546]QDK80845.1 terminase small subunit [Spirosoma sp. KCTC 42546]
MTDIQRRFVEEYTKDCKGAAAAIRAGYSKATAKQTAWELKQDPEIQVAIKERLALLTMTADEATKHISDIAGTRLNQFMVIKKVLRREMVRKPLKAIIKELEAKIAFEEEYAHLADLDKKEQIKHKAIQKERERDLIRLKLELKEKPKAYRDVEGEPQWVERAELDLVALAKAEEEGNIFELSFTEFGPKVKMYSAADAMETILKLNGKLINRHDHTNNGKSFGDYLMES